jgi:hypothetical protein
VNDVFERVCFTQDGFKAAMVIAFTHGRSIIQNGQSVHITVGEALEPIQAKQRNFLHGPVLGQIAEQAWVTQNGKRERFTQETWKLVFWKMFVKPIYKMMKLPGWKRPVPVRVNDSSEKLGVRAYAQWIDQIIDYAIAELGVEFILKTEEREEVRGRAKSKQQLTGQ